MRDDVKEKLAKYAKVRTKKDKKHEKSEEKEEIEAETTKWGFDGNVRTVWFWGLYGLKAQKMRELRKKETFRESI